MAKSDAVWCTGVPASYPERRAGTRVLTILLGSKIDQPLLKHVGVAQK
jgi:hypothetical protein